MPKSKGKVQNAINIRSDGNSVGRLDISGEVGFDWYGDAWCAGYFKSVMDDLGDVDQLDVHINSPGGDVIDGIAIFNYLTAHKATVHVHIDGVAASIASVIAMAGDKIFMPSNTLMFVHEPWMYTAGNADELRKDADTLDTMRNALISSYQRHFKGSDSEISDMLKEEKWLTASESSTVFNNIVVENSEVKIAASLDMSKLGEIPAEAQAFLKGAADEKEVVSPSFLARLTTFLKGEGLAVADSSETEPEQTEAEMTPEEKAEMTAEITQGVMAGLKEAGVVAKKEGETTSDKKVEVAFEGDMTDADAVLAHAEKVKMAQMQAAVDWSDVSSVMAYHKALTPKAPKASTQLPAGNADVETDPEAVKAQDRKDTRAAMDSFMPKR